MKYSIGVLREQLLEFSEEAGLEYETARAYYEVTLRSEKYPVVYSTVNDSQIELLRIVADYIRYDGDSFKVAVIRALKNSPIPGQKEVGATLETEAPISLDQIFEHPFFKTDEYLGFRFGVRMLMNTGGNLAAFIDYIVAQSITH
ncbi:MAG: hypothetical protein KF802_02375 [Bdellovibrionaceae bacterium]|nr:hypothetical protein [Pseudobdellovibrionaceae bacterium]